MPRKSEDRQDNNDQKPPPGPPRKDSIGKERPRRESVNANNKRSSRDKDADTTSARLSNAGTTEPFSVPRDTTGTISEGPSVSPLIPKMPITDLPVSPLVPNQPIPVGPSVSPEIRYARTEVTEDYSVPPPSEETQERVASHPSLSLMIQKKSRVVETIILDHTPHLDLELEVDRLVSVAKAQCGREKEALRKKLDVEFQNMKKKYEDEIEKMKKDIIEPLKKEIRNLQEKLEEAIEAGKENKRIADDYKNQNNALRDQIERLNEIVNDLKKQLEAYIMLEQELEKAKRDNKALKEEMERVIDKITTENQKQIEAYKAMEKELENSKGDYQDHSETLEKLLKIERENAALQAAIDKLKAVEDENRNLKEAAKQSNEEIQLLKQRMDQGADQNLLMDMMIQNLKTCEEENRKLKAQLDSELAEPNNIITSMFSPEIKNHTPEIPILAHPTTQEKTCCNSLVQSNINKNEIIVGEHEKGYVKSVGLELLSMVKRITHDFLIDEDQECKEKNKGLHCTQSHISTSTQCQLNTQTVGNCPHQNNKCNTQTVPSCADTGGSRVNKINVPNPGCMQCISSAIDDYQKVLSTEHAMANSFQQTRLQQQETPETSSRLTALEGKFNQLGDQVSKLMETVIQQNTGIANKITQVEMEITHWAKLTYELQNATKLHTGSGIEVGTEPHRLDKDKKP